MFGIKMPWTRRRERREHEERERLRELAEKREIQLKTFAERREAMKANKPILRKVEASNKK